MAKTNTNKTNWNNSEMFFHINPTMSSNSDIINNNVVINDMERWFIETINPQDFQFNRCLYLNNVIRVRINIKNNELFSMFLLKYGQYIDK